MRVTKDGDYFRASHASGPTHNLLRMRIRSASHASIIVRVLPAIGGCSHGAPIEAEETRDWISVGVERANSELGTDYCSIEAEVIANDSRRPEVYAELARRIVIAAHQGMNS